MDSLTLIRTRLEHATRTELKAVAEFTGVPFHTLRKIVDGETRNPRYQTIEPLRKYVESIPTRIAA
jgi:predicted transcriptional regulator